MAGIHATVPVLASLDLAESRQFYTERLGFDCLHASADYLMLRRDGCELHLWRDEIAALQIAAQIIIVFRDFLTFGESHVHPVGFSCKIPAMEEHSKFKSHAGIGGALVLAFPVH